MKIKADYQGKPVTVTAFEGRFAVLDSGERVLQAEVFQFADANVSERFSLGKNTYKAVPKLSSFQTCLGCNFRHLPCGHLPACSGYIREDKQDIIWVKE